MHILIYGTNPRLESGMGKVGVEMAKGLAAEHEISYFAPNSVGPPETFPPDALEAEQFTLYGQPNPGGPGAQMFNHYLGKLQPDVVLTNRNWQSLDWLDDSLNNRYMNMGDPTPLVMYGPPVEAIRKPPLFEQQLLEDHLNSVFCVPYTENQYHTWDDDWGLGEYLLPVDRDGCWVPHGVDHDIFNPDAADEAAGPGFRDGLGLGDRFVVTFVGENWRRKNLDLLLDAWGDFRDGVMAEGGERPFLLLHTDPGASRGDDQFYSGWRVVETAFGYDLNPATSLGEVTDDADLVVTKEYKGAFDPREVVAAHFAEADAMCLPTSGEGFSLTSLEAMACGCPIAQTDLDTLRWLCGDAAEYISWDQTHAINSGEQMVTPDADDVERALWTLYNQPDVREDMAQAGLDRAQDFSWGRMRDGLLDALDYVEASMP